MFEDFRKQTDETSFPAPEPEEESYRDRLLANEPEVHFLCMTAFQRFALMVLIFVMIIVVGILLLLVTQRVMPPFLS